MLRTSTALLMTCLIMVPAGAAPLQLFSIREREEIELGRAAARQVEREHRLVRDLRITRYVQRLGERLADSSERPDLHYRFKVIDERRANAFALPGGFVYLNLGILRLAENESEVAGVMAHEIAHVTGRHGVEQTEKAQTIGLGLGLLDLLLGGSRSTTENLAALGANLFAQGVFSKYSRDAEREADQVGVAILRRAGIHPAGMVTLFQRLERVRRTQPSLVEHFFSSHPSLEERQRNISGMLRSSDDRLDRDSAEFRSLSRRLR